VLQRHTNKHASWHVFPRTFWRLLGWLPLGRCTTAV
jgi:hypothetical protein